MSFVVDAMAKKVTFTVKQEIRFVDILDSFAWMDGLQDADDLNLTPQETLNIIMRFAKAYEDGTDFDWLMADLQDAVMDVMDQLYDEDWGPEALKKQRKKPIINVTPTTTNKKLALKPPDKLLPEEENFELEEAATPEEFQCPATK